MASTRDKSSSRPVRKLVIRDSEIGILRKKEFRSFTNFAVQVLCACTTPKAWQGVPCSGFIFEIYSRDSSRTGECFIDNHDIQSLRTFMKAATRQNGGDNLLYAKVPDDLWSMFILEIVRDFMSGPSRQRKTLTTCLGRQPESMVWVFGPEIHIDERGDLIPKENQTFFWHPDSIASTDCRCLVPSPSIITLPLSLNGLQQLLLHTKRCLANNYFSSFIGLAAAVLCFHFEVIQEFQDESPVVLCYSQNSGTGKSTTLRNIVSVFGTPKQIYSHKTSVPSIVNQASFTTLPLGVDNVNSEKKLEDLVVQFFHGFSHMTVKKEAKPRTGLIITSNSAFANTERNSHRLIHIPFFSPESTKSHEEQLKFEEELMEARLLASQSVGKIISMASDFVSVATKTYLGECLLPLIGAKLPSVPHRLRKCYGLVLVSARLLCQMLPHHIITFEEVVEFFLSTWSPMVEDLHSRSKAKGQINEFVRCVYRSIKQLPTHEVIQMVLSQCSVKGDKVISLYMPMLAAHLSLNERTVDDIKTEVVKNGGKRNASCRFLRPGSRDNVCNSTNNQVRRGVLQIPRQIIDTILLRKIDSVCYSHKLSSDITDSDEESDVADCSRDNGVDSALLQNVLAGTSSCMPDAADENNEMDGSDNSTAIDSDTSLSQPPELTNAADENNKMDGSNSSTATDDKNDNEGILNDNNENGVSASNEKLQQEALSLLEVTPAEKTVCPPTVCLYKRPRKSTPWVECTNCCQWYHCKCAKTTLKQAQANDQWKCTKCCC